MIILGIHDGHNASVCLYKDGEILSALQEERLRRVKNWSGIPEKSIKWILKKYNISVDEIDKIALSGDHMPMPKTRDELLKEYREIGELSLKYELKKSLRQTFLKDILVSKRKTQRVSELEALGLDKAKIEFVDHHLCHASSSYYGYGNFKEKILVLTCDGAGDSVCATVNIGENGKLERIRSVKDTESLASLYAVITFLMGMVPLEHEYKLMGMAPYADEKASDKVFQKLMNHFKFNEKDPMTWERINNIPPTFYSYAHIRKLLQYDRFDGIMGGVQKFSEVMLTQWVKNCIEATGIKKVVLGGGIFMNVKANKTIMELDEVDDIFIYPSCGDETNAMGACYQLYAKYSDINNMKPLEDIYFGPEYSNDEVLNEINEYKFENCEISFEKHENIEEVVAKLIKEGNVVARFSGKEEFGARSLGNRAILADPSNTEIIKVINEMIKNRDFWMPFACSMKSERESDYLINKKNIKAPYMILSFDTTDKINEIKAGSHPYDLTVRPQMVYQEHNSNYHKLITEFEKITGIGALLNTSFNLHGFPIVSSPSDALEVLDKSGLNYLMIENYLVSKK